MAEEVREKVLFKFLRDAVLTIVGGVVIEPTLRRLSFDVSPYVEQIWFCVFCFITIDGLP